MAYLLECCVLRGRKHEHRLAQQARGLSVERAAASATTDQLYAPVHIIRV